MKIRAVVAGLFSACWVLLSAGHSAHSATFTPVGAFTTGELPANFDLNLANLGLSSASEVYFADAFGSGLGINGPAEISLTYFGKEAAYNNIFNFNSGEIIFRTNERSRRSNNSPQTVSVNFLTVGLLPFVFLSDGSRSSAIANGSGAGLTDSIAFILFNNFTEALILFNDNARVDKDYDDMAILMRIIPVSQNIPTPVPVPASIVLLISALIGVGALARRKRSPDHLRSSSPNVLRKL